MKQSNRIAHWKYTQSDSDRMCQTLWYRKLVVQLEDGTLYQSGEFLELCKDSLHNCCKIIIEKLRLDKARRKSAVCKIVQQVD